MNDILSEQMEKALDTIRGICKVSLDCEFCPFYMGDNDDEMVCNCFFVAGHRGTPDGWDSESLKEYEKPPIKTKLSEYPICNARNEALCERLTKDGFCTFKDSCPNKGRRIRQKVTGEDNGN